MSGFKHARCRQCGPNVVYVWSEEPLVRDAYCPRCSTMRRPVKLQRTATSLMKDPERRYQRPIGPGYRWPT